MARRYRNPTYANGRKKPPKKRKQMSGGAKLKASGQKAILLGVTVQVLAKLREAASIEQRSVAGFVRYHAAIAAEKLITHREQMEDGQS